MLREGRGNAGQRQLEAPLQKSTHECGRDIRKKRKFLIVMNIHGFF
jgi:hypothetical protein